MKLQTWASVIVVLTWLVGDDPLCAVEASPSASADYAINRSYSTIGFSIYKWIVMKEEGVFREFYGSVHYDPAKPERSHIVITAQAASLDTGNSGRDAVLRSDDFFDAAKYPTLHFESEAVTVKDSHEIVLAGKLTIHGVTKQISIPVHINGTSDVPGVGTLAGFETTFTIDRTGYGVNGLRWSAGQLAIGNQVTIHIALGCLRTSAPRSEATALPTFGPYRTTESVRCSPDAYSQGRRIPIDEVDPGPLVGQRLVSNNRKVLNLFRPLLWGVAASAQEASNSRAGNVLNLPMLFRGPQPALEVMVDREGGRSYLPLTQVAPRWREWTAPWLSAWGSGWPPGESSSSHGLQNYPQRLCSTSLPIRSRSPFLRTSSNLDASVLLFERCPSLPDQFHPPVRWFKPLTAAFTEQLTVAAPTATNAADGEPAVFNSRQKLNGLQVARGTLGLAST